MKANRCSAAALLLPLMLLCFSTALAADDFYVKRVYSGDYIKLRARTSEEKDLRVRYIGVDAPDKGRPFFELCRKVNRELVYKKRVLLQADNGTSEISGKLLRYVFVGDVLVNAEMIKNGAALVAPPDGNNRYRELLLALQQEARKAGRGLWAYEDQSDEPYYVGSKSKKIFHRPNCPRIKRLDFEDRLIFRTKGEALAAGYGQDWRCCPLFKKPE